MDEQVLVVTDGTSFKAFYKNKRLRKTELPKHLRGDTSHCNPFGVYGNALSDWLGFSKFNLSINVARIESGKL